MAPQASRLRDVRSDIPGPVLGQARQLEAQGPDPHASTLRPGVAGSARPMRCCATLCRTPVTLRATGTSRAARAIAILRNRAPSPGSVSARRDDGRSVRQVILAVTAMPDFNDREGAAEPEDLGWLFLERASADDVDGVVASYKPAAALASPSGGLAIGVAAIRRVHEVCVPRIASTALTSRVARPALPGDDHRSCACGWCSS
jgi:hypothetical protein